MDPGAPSVGWICALTHELAASRAMLEEEYTMPTMQQAGDDNVYAAGRIGEHNVIMACLPAGKIGVGSAAIAARDMRHSFKSVRFVLMVGIGGGVPSDEHDIRLGDVVVSKPTQNSGGIIQYDMGKVKTDGSFERRGHLNEPPRQLLNALQTIQANHEMRGCDIHVHLRSIFERFPRMSQAYGRPTLEDSAFGRTVRKDASGQSDSLPWIHYGLIASGNKVIANETERDRLRRTDDILCFEMEAAGLLDAIPCLVVRGISDYADGSKNDTWQRYAAAVAAAYSKELLLSISSKLVRSLPTILQSSQTTNFHLPFEFYDIQPVPNYIERHDAIGELESFFKPGSRDTERQKIFAVQGMGGIGKTQLCVRYFQKHKSNYSASIWMNGSSENALKKSFRDLAVRLSRINATKEHIESMEDTSVKELVFGWLAQEDNYAWLLVIDNIDLDVDTAIPDPQAYDVQDYIPKINHGSILVTSRLQTLDDLGGHLSLRQLDVLQSRQILENKVGRTLTDDRDADETIERLQGLPLALTLAGAYIKDFGCSFATYNSRYDKQWARLAAKQDQRRVREYYNRRLLTTWTISYDQVKALSEDAIRLFELGSFLSNSGLCFNLFLMMSQQSIGSEWPLWLQRVSASEADFAEEMAYLVKYGLVNHNGSHQTYLTHNLIHEWSFHVASQRGCSEQEMLFKIAATLVASVLKLDDADHLYWQRVGEQYSNCLAVERRIHVWRGFGTMEQTDIMNMSNTFFALGRLLGEFDDYTRAEQMYEQALQGYEKASGPEHISTLSTVNNVGTLYRKQERLDESEKMYERALQGCERAFGREHTSTLNTVNNLGSLYYTQGKLDKAEKMYERALQGTEKTLGRDHTSVLATVNNLGLLYRDQAKLEEAEKMYERALQGYEKVLGREHISTLTTVHNLGLLYYNQGKLDEAEKMYERTLQGREKTLGREHTSTLETVNNLGLLYNDQAKFDEAEKMYERALRGYDKVLGREHPSTLTIVDNVTITYLKKGEFHQANTMSKRLSRETIAKYAALPGSEEFFRGLLAEGYPPETVSNLGRTALHFAAFSGQSSVGQLLIQKGANTNAIDNRGSTPLTWASECGHANMVELLLSDLSTDVNAFDLDGDTPLILAAAKGHENIVQLLLQQPRLAVNMENNEGFTALGKAEALGNETIVALIRSYTAALNAAK